MAMSITADVIAARLGGARRAGEGWSCRCPAHEDKKASLWIKDRASGGLHVKCHAGCASENVAEKLKSMGLWPTPGVRKRDNKDERRRTRAGFEIDAIISPVPADWVPPDWRALGVDAPTILYEYRDELERLTGYVARWSTLTGEKKIRPISLAKLKSGEVKWVFAGPQERFHLYNLSDLIARPEAPVLIVEGEKAADAGKNRFSDHVVVTWRSGAAAAERSDFSWLKDRYVVLWPDADEPGKKAMSVVAKLARAAGAISIHQVDLPPGVPKGWDVADVEPEGIDAADLLQNAVEVSFEEVGEDGDRSEAPLPASGPGLRPLVVGADELMKLELPERTLIVDPFLAISSLSMIYGPRGSGKTWVSLSLAMAVAQGVNFLAYTIERPWTVLFIDGEMAIADLQQRVRLLCPSPPPALLILPSERLFREARPLNLHDPEDQKAIEQMIAVLESEGRRPDMMIFDNLSSLSGGVDENDNSALDHLLRWLISLRHMGMAIVLVHHAGKNGSQRGASRREDLLDTSISLTLPSEDASPHKGAHLVLTFAKTRGERPDPEALELRLAEYNGQLQWQFGNPAQIDRATEILRIAWERRPKTQAELAAYAGVKESAISHQVKKLRRDDYLEDGSPPTLTQSGRERLIEVWPELYSQMVEQGELALRDIL